jgi:hypothetical protein
MLEDDSWVTAGSTDQFPWIRNKEDGLLDTDLGIVLEVITD